MMSPPQRFLHASGAAVLGASLYVTLFAVALAICVVTAQQAALWFQTGSFEFAAPAVPAGYRTDVSVAGATQSEARAVGAALATLRYKPPSDAIAYKVTTDLCPQCSGDFVSGINLIQLSPDVVRAGGPVLRQTLAHEIGHYVDFNLLTDRERARFYRLRGIPMKRLWIDPKQPWEQTPSEDFAEVFATLDAPTGKGRPLTVYGPVTHPAAFEKLLREAGVRFGRQQPLPSARTATRRQLSVAIRVLSDQRNRRLVLAGLLISGGFGAVSWWRKAWRRSWRMLLDV